MAISIVFFSYCLIQLAIANPLPSHHACTESVAHIPPNTNHIFNAIHSSMRQWGSSLNHNGMSFFLVTVPEGVQFYHGTHTPKPVTGMEWLAFEPEHAMMFAGGRRPPRRPPRGPGEPEEPPNHPGHGPPQNVPGGGPPPAPHGRQRQATGQTPIHSADTDNSNMTSGWLHTYAAKKDLRLLYLDGMSAAKSELGTLDSQDYVLLNDTDEHPGFYDVRRASLLCKLAREEWDGRIDGFLRMEAGFEIILCSFKQNLDAIRITRAKDAGAGGSPRRRHDFRDHFAYFRAITDRYHGVGGGRVIVDYESFLTAYTYPFDLFPTGEELPRLQNLSADSAALLKADIDALVMSKYPATDSRDWQSITDMIVQRYANPLKYITSGALSTARLVQAEAGRWLQPFIDFEFRNTTAEIERCTNQFLPQVYEISLASRVLSDISNLICSTLHSVLEEEKYDLAFARIQALIDYLDWTTWKDCGGCAVDEICFTAIWPQGSLEDRKHPSCTNATSLQTKHGSYWGDFWHDFEGKHARTM